MKQTGSFLERIGMHPELAIGYFGLLLFMIGDGVEAGFLSPYLLDQLHFSESRIAVIFTLYGVTAAIASWLSGALSDIFGPKRVMWMGFVIWITFEIPFLVFGIHQHNFSVILITYMLRGFGYPLFAFGFLIWITHVTPNVYLATAIGWFWCARTGGLPTLGSLLASYSVPRYGAYFSLWISVVLVLIGGLIALFGIREKRGAGPAPASGKNQLSVLFSSLSIAWKKPKVGLGGIVAAVTTTSEFGFLVCLPIFYVHTVGFTLPQWLRILTIMFATNVVFNLFWGIVGDRIGWRKTITFAGSCGCAVSTLGLYYVPHIFGATIYWSHSPAWPMVRHWPAMFQSPRSWQRLRPNRAPQPCPS
jgi:MFS family permease